MSKNTLTFSEAEISGELNMSSTPIADDNTIWKGGSVTIPAGGTLKITSFPEGCDAVLLLSGSSVLQTLTPASPSYTNSGNSSVSYNIGVYNGFKEQEVGYEVGEAPVTAGWNVGGGTYQKVTIDGVEYYADPTSYAPTGHIAVSAGEKIVLSTPDVSGANVLLYTTNKSKRPLIPLTAEGYTAPENLEFAIVGSTIYKLVSVEYQIVSMDTEQPDTAIDSTMVYASEGGINFGEGDTITLKTDVEALLITKDGSVIHTFTGEGDEFTAIADGNNIYFAVDSDSISSVEYEILPDASRREYEAEYTGGSGILQLRHAMGARVRVYGDAGAGYMLIHKMEGKEIVRAVNMEGFNSMKFVSDGEIDECIINEFGTSSNDDNEILTKGA